MLLGLRVAPKSLALRRAAANTDRARSGRAAMAAWRSADWRRALRVVRRSAVRLLEANGTASCRGSALDWRERRTLSDVLDQLDRFPELLGQRWRQIWERSKPSKAL